jgi:hypothetical protein
MLPALLEMEHRTRVKSVKQIRKFKANRIRSASPNGEGGAGVTLLVKCVFLYKLLTDYSRLITVHK